MKREKIDFTDAELLYVAMALQVFINDRNFYIPKRKVRILESAMQKVINNSFTRKNPEKIIYPLIDFS